MLKYILGNPINKHIFFIMKGENTMAKNSKKKVTRTNNTAINNTTNTAVNTGSSPFFVIPAVEGDICRKGKSTEEICSKYGRSEEELHALIRKAYHGSESRVREIFRVLEKNDAQYARRKAAQERRVEEQPVQANINSEPSKTPLEIQQDAVKAAQDDLANKVEALSKAEKEIRQANANRDTAQENLRKAREALNQADDAVMMAKSKKHTAEEELRASRSNYDQQVALLNEMSSKKLIHISAVKDGLPSGKLYMSAYDYAKLSDADKEKVIPVNTEDSTFAHYPDNFYQYPSKLGMEGYQSACNYALAYVKLILDAQDDVAVELVCNDNTVKELATMQNV